MPEKSTVNVSESPEEAGYVDTQYFDYGDNDEADVGNYDYSEASYDEAPIIESGEESTQFDNLLIQSTQEQNERKDEQVVDVNFHSFENLVRNSNEASGEKEGQIDILLPQIKLNLQSTTFEQILDPDLTSVPPTSDLPDDRQPADEPSYATERTKEALNLPQQTITALIKPGIDIEL